MPTLLANTETPLDFGTDLIEAAVVHRAENYRIDAPTIVVNPTTRPVTIGARPHKTIPAWSSTILRDTTVQDAEHVLTLRCDPDAVFAGLMHDPGWQRFGDLDLWKGPQHTLGTLDFDPAHALGERPEATAPETFRMTANLWFAPAATDCAIHNRHDFIEVHTQVHGHGRMQKFHHRDHATLYQDIRMSPGYTTPDPFCATADDGSFAYPWHQYYADTDCVWLALEFHATDR
ncbi:hypothetical protein AB0Q95_36065 [Streptomyces sp. NPDC059900]|uniref:hypothetical protein n=1 Tax=Streptomyces sp. NPDC059900 TaxID=3155816 RepID=UPI00344950B5